MNYARQKIVRWTRGWGKLMRSKIARLCGQASSILIAALLVIGTAHSKDMNEAQLISITLDLVKKAGDMELIEAVEKCQKRDARSCFVLGAAFVFSHGVKKNAPIGIFWETKAAELGYADAQYNLSIEYRDGVSVEKNLEKGIYWERLAAENEHQVAMFNLALAACDGQRAHMTCKDGLRYLQKSSQKGFAPAKTSLGLMYLRGQEVNKDYATAKIHFREAMNLGDPDAFCWTGYMYCRGIGVEMDCEKGGGLIRKAATMGSAICSKLRL